MRVLVSFLVCIVCCIVCQAQNDLHRMVDTEKAFAQLSADKDTRTAFLSYMTDDALVFTPQQTKAKPFWEARTPNKSLLSWSPNFADISSNGVLGYTTGNWEWRANGKDDTPSAFGEFITLWLRQPDGMYKWVVDIGVEHAKPEKYSTKWIQWTNKIRVLHKGPLPKPEDSDFTQAFFQMVEAKGLAKAYEKFAFYDIRGYREGKPPILGQRTLLNVVNDDKGVLTFEKPGTVFSSDNLAYMLTGYQKKTGNKIEKGNYLQIWKFTNWKWYIVLEIFKPAE